MEDVKNTGTSAPVNPVEPEVKVETPPEVPVEKTETREIKPLPIWLVLIILVIFIVLLGLNYNACSNVKQLEKAGIESKKQFDSLAKKTKALESDLSNTKASLLELEDAYTDSIEYLKNPTWFQLADSLAYENKNNATGGVK